jgi:serine/threonine protein kinase
VALSASISLPLAGNGCRSSSTTHEEAISAVRLLAAEISLGLLFLHHNSIVHQDIKPANIMISSTGHAVIGDFGAASRLPLDGRSSSALSGTSFDDNRRAIVLQPEEFITFTPLYAAPEMRERNIDGLVVYDERADWWSFGVLLYELVTGSAPFNLSIITNTLRRLSRTDGDNSLSFGRLEKLSLSWRAHGDCCEHLENFLRSVSQPLLFGCGSSGIYLAAFS